MNSKQASSKVDAHLALLYLDYVPEEYFTDIRAWANSAKLDLHEESREPTPYAALEWIVPTAIAIYIGKPFVDAFLKRAADDVANALYPKFKSHVLTLVRKALVRDRSNYKIVSSSPNKISNPISIIFSILAQNKAGDRVKFVFHKELEPEQYDTCIRGIFSLLEAHFKSEDDSDDLTTECSKMDSRHGTFYMTYDTEASSWVVADPVAEAFRKQQPGNDAV